MKAANAFALLAAILAGSVRIATIILCFVKLDNTTRILNATMILSFGVAIDLLLVLVRVID
jgi:hypothetical protein